MLVFNRATTPFPYSVVPARRLGKRKGTYLESGKHAQMHRVIRTLRNVQHHLQTVLKIRRKTVKRTTKC